MLVNFYLFMSLFQQQGSLCAQHCLNALLQGSYFTAVDLATIGHRMDDEERSRMAEAGISSEEYNQFLQVTLLLHVVFIRFTDFKNKLATFLKCR